MLELLMLVVLLVLLAKALGLAFRVSWSVTKAVAMGLLTLALPVFLGCVAVLGGLALLAPVLLIGAGVALLKRC